MIRKLRLARCLLWFVVLAGVVARTPEVAAETHALLVGIDRVQDRNVKRLLGAGNDVDWWRHVLTRQLGVRAENLTVLRDEQATKANIQAAFMAIQRRSQPGDTVFFEFSGHGTRLADDDGDEMDLWDEALCPYEFDSKRAAETAIRDDVLNQWLDCLMPLRVVVVLDCCHSGTGTKEVDSFGDVRFFPSSQTPPQRVAPVQRHLPPTTQSRIVYTACGAEQESREFSLSGRTAAPLRCGSLTYVLASGLQGIADANADGYVSYRELWNYAALRSNAIRNGNQQNGAQEHHPTFETSIAAEADRPFLEVTKLQPLYAVVHRTDERVEQLQADLGLLQGWKTGLPVLLHSFDGKRPGNVLANSVIRSAREQSVEIQQPEAKIDDDPIAVTVEPPRRDQRVLRMKLFEPQVADGKPVLARRFLQLVRFESLSNLVLVDRNAATLDLKVVLIEEPIHGGDRSLTTLITDANDSHLWKGHWQLAESNVPAAAKATAEVEQALRKILSDAAR